MATTAIQALPYPLTSDAANVSSWNQQLAQAVEVKLNMVFATTAARDAAIPSPTAGMECFITGTGEKQVRSASGAWMVEGGRATPFAMAAGSQSMSMGAAASAATTTGIALPAGRFSVAPLMWGSLLTAPSDAFSGIQPIFLSVTTTTFTLEVTATGGSTWPNAQNVTVGWFAVQMTSAAAAG